MGNLSTLGPLLIGISLLSLALRQFGKARREWREWRAYRDWPTAPGKITSSRVKYDAPVDDPDYSHAYQPDVHYQYTVAGVPYSSVGFAGDDMWREDDAQRMVDRYPLHAEVRIYYDPDAPRFSMLELPALNTITGPFAVAGVLAFTGGVMVIISIIQLTG